MDLIPLALTWYFVFIFTLTCHEAGHALAATILGDKTSYLGGQLTLNPIPHIQREPLGMIIFPIITFFMGGWMMGWASCPYDPIWAYRYPKRAAIMAIAGPAANLVLVIIAGIMLRVGLEVGWFRIPETFDLHQVVVAQSPGFLNSLAVILSITFSLNIILFAFNLIPLPPLDGSAALGLTLKPETANRYQAFFAQPGISIIGLVIAWHFGWMVIRPVLFFALNLLYSGTA